MIGLHNLKPAYGAKHRRKIIGRGEGSGHGGSSTRGMKGQKSRSGDGVMTGFEGGQMPLLRRIPKRGFTNKFKKEFSIVNLDVLDANFNSGDEVNYKNLLDKGLIKKDLPIKILGNGNISKPLVVKANVFSKSAFEKIKTAGGTPEKV